MNVLNGKTGIQSLCSREGGIAISDNSKYKYKEPLEAKWSRSMAIDRLRKIADASIRAVNQENPRNRDAEACYNPNAAATAIKAIETANKMLGYNGPEKEPGEGEVMVILGEGEEFAQ